MKIWDAGSRQCVHTFYEHLDQVSCGTAVIVVGGVGGGGGGVGVGGGDGGGGGVVHLFTYFTVGPSIFAVIGFVGCDGGVGGGGGGGGGGVSIRIFYDHLDQMGLGLHFEPSEYHLNKCVCICLAGEPVVFHGKNCLFVADFPINSI